MDTHGSRYTLVLQGMHGTKTITIVRCAFFMINGQNKLHTIMENCTGINW